MNILNSKSIDKGNSPKDITIIRKMFDNLGIEEYEKNTLNYMSEFINSYIIDILKEAKKNMNLAKREKINIEDVELAVSTKQNHMYKNRPIVQDMKFIADRINSIELPPIPENPIVLRPPIENNLLRNNFQIYSEELNQALQENKQILENTSLRADEINMLGNKRKVNFGNESRNNLNYEYGGKAPKNKRKISLNQAFKKSSQENAKKEGLNLIENNTNNIKLNLTNTKKISSVKNNSNLNSVNNNADDIFDDNDNDEIDNTNNNMGESTINKKEDDDEKMDEEDEMGDEDVEGEELEGENEEENESNINGNESLSKKDDQTQEQKDNKFKFIHEEEIDEEDYDDDKS